MSVRDLAAVIAAKTHGATTVAATMRIAHAAGIRVFATGGHRFGCGAPCVVYTRASHAMA